MPYGVEVLITKESDLLALSETLREADKNELKANSGLEPLQGLVESWLHADYCYTAFEIEHPSIPICVFGLSIVCYNNKILGIPWMMASERAFSKLNAMKALLYFGRLFIRDSLNRDVSFLVNMADARNTKHLAFLDKLGAVFAEPIIAGFEKRRFYPFKFTKENNEKEFSLCATLFQ